MREHETDGAQRFGMDPAPAAAGDHDGRDGASPFPALDDSLAGLAASAVHAAQPASPRGAGGSRLKLIAAAVILVALVGGGVYASRRSGGTTPVPQLGTLLVQSSPAGVEVFVDGVSRGMTPASVSVSAGSHILELRGRGVPRVIPLQVPAGGQVSQYLEFVDTPTTGMLVVHSQPVGANVTVDGVARGVAPITIEGLTSGDHEVVLQSAAGTSRHTVKVLAGTTASLVAPVVAAPAPVDGPVSGWVSVKAPFLIEIREDGQLIGTTETDRLMLAVRPSRAGVREPVARVPRVAHGAGAARQGRAARDRAAAGIGQPQRLALGRGVDRRPPDRRDADRQRLGADRPARNRVPSSRARREEAGRLGDDRRAGPGQRLDEVNQQLETQHDRQVKP